jgi:hypothetical protein
MLISADLKCYYCGHVSGEVIADSAHPDRIRAFRPNRAEALTTDNSHPRRCVRCGGPVFLDEAQTLSLREATTLIRAARARAEAPPAQAKGQTPSTRVG